MTLECSIVFMLRFLGTSHVVLYGLNDRYELVVLLVNWRKGRTIGRMRLVHSGNWTIRDICTVSWKGDEL